MNLSLIHIYWYFIQLSRRILHIMVENVESSLKKHGRENGS